MACMCGLAVLRYLCSAVCYAPCVIPGCPSLCMHCRQRMILMSRKSSRVEAAAAHAANALQHLLLTVIKW